MLKDINPGSANSFPGGFYGYTGKVYFAANDGTHGRELWTTDGTVSGIFMVKDIYPGPSGGSAFGSRVESNGKLYFGGGSPEFGYNLWESDGTEAGTIIVRPENSTVNDPLIDSFIPVGTVFQDELYFMAMYDENKGIEPYKLAAQPLSVASPLSQNITLYPNPTGSDLLISTNQQIEKAKVYNLQGQLLISRSGTQTQNQSITLDLSGLLPGVYFVKITGHRWEETHKVIKK